MTDVEVLSVFESALRHALRRQEPARRIAQQARESHPELSKELLELLAERWASEALGAVVALREGLEAVEAARLEAAIA